jgi:hypothetical protein
VLGKFGLVRFGPVLAKPETEPIGLAQTETEPFKVSQNSPNRLKSSSVRFTLGLNHLRESLVSGLV